MRRGNTRAGTIGPVEALASGALVAAGPPRWTVSFDIRLYRHLSTRRAAVDAAWQELCAHALETEAQP